MRSSFAIFLSVVGVSLTLAADGLSWKDVDPMIGTGATGHAFPGPCRPFGFVQPSPDTGNGDWDHCGGYAWTDAAVRRFSQTHVCGAGQAGLGDVGLLPFVGAAPDPGTASVPFRKADERAELGLYRVTLANGVRVEIAAGRRLARYRMTFPAGCAGGVMLDFAWGLYRQPDYLPHLSTDCLVTRADARRWEGFSHSEIWGARDIWSVVTFSRTPSAVEELGRDAKGTARQVAVFFDGGGVVEAAVAISATSAAGAGRNYEAEAALSFDDLVAETRREWDGLLARVKAESFPAADRVTVASAVYRLCIQPNDISDAGEPPRYSTFSLWDTFRDAHPLYERLVPERIAGFVNSLLAHYDRWGYLPQWELWGRETGGMIGSHAVPVVVDACLHGFEGIDVRKAYRAVRDTLTKEERPGMGRAYPRRTDWSVYDRYGYYPFDLIPRESVSRTLECCFDDFKAAALAERLGETADAAFFTRRSWNFTNLFDRATLCFRGRDSRGRWRTPFEPARVGSTPDYTEATALQYSWHVLHHPAWLVEAMGGRQAFLERLDGFFAGTLFRDQPRDYASNRDITGLIGDYAHGNEPCHHIPSLSRLAGRPEKTEELFDRIRRTCYRPTPDGLCGNEDCGQMSAWYLRSLDCIGR